MGFPPRRTSRKVAVYSIQGWTDDLFRRRREHAHVQATQAAWTRAGRSRSSSPTWAITRSQNKPHRLAAAQRSGLAVHAGQHRGKPRAANHRAARATLCPGEPNQDAAQRLTATSPEGLSKGGLSVQYANGGTVNNPAGVADALNNLRSDPVFGEPGCKEGPQSAFPLQFAKYSATSPPLGEHSIYVGLGKVRLPHTTVPAPTAHDQRACVGSVAKRRRAADQPGYLPVRAPAYDKSPEDLTVPLFGNHFALEKGHKLRLEVTLVDFPTFRPSNVPSEVSFENPTLRLPTREASQRETTEAPAP